MSVLILDNKRILLNGIRRYELNSDKFYYRNDNEEERFLFIWLTNPNELWSKYSFKYLFIKMVDDKEYKFVSDIKLTNLMEQMEYYFEVNDIDLDADLPEEDAYLEEAIESYKKIKDSYIFIKDDISYITNKMDYAFGTI